MAKVRAETDLASAWLRSDYRAAQDYSPQTRRDRLIAGARFALACFSLLAVRLDPTDPDRHGRVLLALFAAYALYAAVVVGLTWRSGKPLGYARVRHLTDLVIVSLSLYLSQGTASPFVPLFVFALLAGGLRWQWRGSFWTAVGVLAVFGGMGSYAAVTADPAFALNRYVLYSTSLIVVAALLGQVGLYEQRVRRDMVNLAKPPEVSPLEMETLFRRLSEWAAGLMGTRRALVAWEDPDEPWLNLASWEDGDFRLAQEPPGVLEPLVAEQLMGQNFLCGAAGASRPAVLYVNGDGFKRWDGAPLHPALRTRFSVSAVLSFSLVGERLTGRLFFFDKKNMTSDDLILGGIVARYIGNRVNEVYLLKRLGEQAVLEERVRLARDLHDGALHSLAGMALELESLLRAPEPGLERVRERLLETQRSLVEEQRTLRLLIGDLRASPPAGLGPDAGLSVRLEELARRLERQWGLRVECRLEGVDALPTKRVNDVYLLVHEALFNVARHADASLARLEVSVREGRVRLVVADNGRGFAFKGRYDHPTLAALRLGPGTLKERVALLGGTLTIDSTESGARVEVTVPVEPGA